MISTVIRKTNKEIKTLEQINRFSGERYKVNLLWREDDVRLPNNFYSSTGQLTSLQKNDTLQKRYQETKNTNFKAGSAQNFYQFELKEARDSFNGI